MFEMKFTTGNASFRSFEGDTDELFCRIETINMLKQVINRIEEDRMYSGPVIDSWGNKIGEYEFDWSE